MTNGQKGRDQQCNVCVVYLEKLMSSNSALEKKMTSFLFRSGCINEKKNVQTRLTLSSLQNVLLQALLISYINFDPSLYGMHHLK